MDTRSNIVSAINSFTSWERPWEFFPSVSSSPNLSTEERAVLEQIWEIAASEGTWVSLAEGSTNARALLTANYPWLPENALRQLVNGAAYQWR